MLRVARFDFSSVSGSLRLAESADKKDIIHYPLERKETATQM